MSVWRKSGRVFKPTGITHLIAAETKKVNLQPVQRIHFSLDPFHPNADVLRNVMYIMSFPKIRDTNFKTVVKTNIVSDKSEPTVEFKLQNGKTLLLKTGNLTLLEVLQQVNKYILPLVPPPQDLSASVPKTKSQKKK